MTGMAVDPDPTWTNGATCYTSTMGYTNWNTTNVSNYSHSFHFPGRYYEGLRLMAESEEEYEKLIHAIEMRKRNLGYLWQPFHGVKRLRFRVVAPRKIFQPCWSSRRFASRTSRSSRHEAYSCRSSRGLRRGMARRACIGQAGRVHRQLHVQSVGYAGIVALRATGRIGRKRSLGTAVRA